MWGKIHPGFLTQKNITYINVKKLTIKKGVQEVLKQCSLRTNGNLADHKFRLIKHEDNVIYYITKSSFRKLKSISGIQILNQNLRHFLL